MPTTTSPTTVEMGQRFRQARESRGWTFDEAFFQARSKFPRIKISRAQIVHMERGVDRKRIDYGAAVALAGLYDLDLSELDAEVAEEIKGIFEAWNPNSPCSPDFPPNSGFRRLAAA